MKIKVKRSALEWDDFVGTIEIRNVCLPFISWRSQKNNKLVDELNSKNCMCLKINTTSKLFFGITYKKRNIIIHPETFDANNIFSRPLIQNLKHKPNMYQDL